MRQEERVRRIIWQQKIDAEKRLSEESKASAVENQNSLIETSHKFARSSSIDDVVIEVNSVGEIKPLSKEGMQIEKQQEENTPPAVESEPALNSGKFKKKSVK